VRWVLVIAAFIVCGDQISKILVERRFHEGELVVVIDGFFNLVNWRNTGAAWGMLQGFNWVLAIVSVVTIVALYFFRQALHLDHKVGRVALGLIAGGIVGNLIDRVRVGAVIDFLDFHFRGYHWPAFNVADSAICTGVALYIFISWRVGERPAAASNQSG